MEVIRPDASPDLDRALKALALAESATVFGATTARPATRLNARAAVETARRRIAELRTTVPTNHGTRNVSNARIDALSARLAQAEAHLNEEKP